MKETRIVVTEADGDAEATVLVLRASDRVKVVQTPSENVIFLTVDGSRADSMVRTTQTFRQRLRELITVYW